MDIGLAERVEAAREYPETLRSLRGPLRFHTPEEEAAILDTLWDDRGSEPVKRCSVCMRRWLSNGRELKPPQYPVSCEHTRCLVCGRELHTPHANA